MGKVIELYANKWVDYSWGRAFEHRLSGKVAEVEIDGLTYEFDIFPYAVWAFEDGFYSKENGWELVLTASQLVEIMDMRDEQLCML